MKTKIGAITIGLAPRGEILEWLPDDFVVFQEGVLNQLSPEKWDDLAPAEGETPLFTRAGEREIRIATERIEPYLEKAAARLSARGAEFLLLFCSAPLPGFNTEVPLFIPHNLIRNLIERMLPAGRLGVISPDPGQEEMMRESWEKKGRNLIFVSHPPYSDMGFSRDQLKVLKDCDLILADCFGYRVSFRVGLQGATTRPVLLVREITMVFLQQLRRFLKSREDNKKEWRRLK